QLLAVAREGDRVDRLADGFEPARDLRRFTGKRPQTQLPVAAARDQMLAARRDCQTLKRAEGISKWPHDAGLGDVPEQHGAVAAARDGERPLGQEGDAADGSL